MFCPKCGGILVPKKQKNKTVLHCTSCSYVEKDTSKGAITDTVESKDDLAVVDAAQDMESLPEMEEECPKCHHNKARYWVIQTRASDEAPTKFIRCEKCGHTWRDYS
jgi:DNA-directed RNA polymerase subunit M